MDYKIVKTFLGINEALLLEEDGYVLNTDEGQLRLTEDFLKKSEHFEPITINEEVTIEEYTPDDIEKRYKMELIIKCTEKERDNIRSFLEKNIEDIKSGRFREKENN
jgi:hypothetical protein